MTRGEDEPLRVVLDTNVLLSALGFEDELNRIWELVEEKRFALFTSPFILAELGKNLISKARLAAAARDALLDGLRSHATILDPPVRLSVIKRNDADNRILECAAEARAHVLVTGNMKDLRPLGAFEGVAILTPREFLVKYFPSSEA